LARLLPCRCFAQDRGPRPRPDHLNALYSRTQFWDGRVETRERQAALPATIDDSAKCGWQLFNTRERELRRLGQP